MKKNKFLLLVGSPRCKKSTSHSLGKKLIDTIKSKGFETETLFLYELTNEEDIWKLIIKINEYSTIILSIPLYVDCFPAHIIKILDFINTHKNRVSTDKKTTAMIINCGFPEPTHNETAIQIYQQFAKQIGFRWAGSLSMGMGGMINGRSLESIGRLVSHIETALEIAADDLIKDSPISNEAILLMKKRIIPYWMYTFFGNMRWKRTIKKHGLNRNDVYRTPHKG